MEIDKFFVDSFVAVTERAAYGASLHKGKGNKIAADQSAVNEMRKQLNKINMKGSIVIGEGELEPDVSFNNYSELKNLIMKLTKSD